MNYTVYIIKSLKDDKFYTGMTTDLKRRLAEHDFGKKSTPSTMKRGPFELVYSEICDTRDLARKREKFLKSGAGREFRDNFISAHSSVVERSLDMGKA